ncbi:coiled-coil domain-containing protein, partial [Micromonospora azadirachtae]
MLRTLAVTGLAAALVAPATAARAEPSPADLNRQIERSSTELERVVESYNKLREDIKTNKAAVDRLQARIGPLERQTEQSRADVAEIAATAYKTGGLQAADALLRPGGSAAMLDRLGTIEHLTRQRQARISGFTESQRQLVDEKTRLNKVLVRQDAQARALANTKSRIERDLARLYDLRRTAYGRATEAPSAPTARP